MIPKVIFSDFDGTLTINGELGSHFFQLLCFLDKWQSDFVIVSGRSLSWGHFLLTHFPLNLCIMEGGGVIVRKGKEGILVEEILVPESALIQLKDLEIAMEKKFPGVLSLDLLGERRIAPSI